MPISKRIQSLTTLVLTAAVIIAANIAASFVYWSIDLTSDKRFTMSKSTYDLVESLTEPVTIEIYLDGELPASFQQLQNSIRELLDELRSRNSRINYTFSNPMDNRPDSLKTAESQKAYLETLRNKGVQAVNISVNNKGVLESHLVFPSATVRMGSSEIVINLLQDMAGLNQDFLEKDAMTRSINLLEYKFANAIQKLQLKSRPRIALLTGHGEMAPPYTSALRASLRDYYDIAELNLDSARRVDTLIDLLFIIKPLAPLGLQHQFMIDQYIMHGGKVIWAIDMLNIELDSFGSRGYYAPFDRQLDFGSQIFNYGARINANIIADLESSKIPMIIGDAGGKPQVELRTWFYHPRAFPYSLPTEREQGIGIVHPIVSNLDYVDTRYPSSIDTIKTRANILKTPLLRSSRYSKIQFPPVSISLELAKANIGQEAFPVGKGYQNIAMLLEGEFESCFRNRIPPEMAQQWAAAGRPILEKGRNTKMIVISDGDILRNEVMPQTGDIAPLGMNKFEGYQYGNRDFIMNCVEYMLDKRGIIATRNKEIKKRPLDQQRAYNEASIWQFINLVLPLLILGLFGGGYIYWRRRKYAK
jgi:ABC-2 type transport system permease protein